MTSVEMRYPWERSPSESTERRKAAAWAWYQHGNRGSGLGRLERRIGGKLSSRFKAEAMKEALSGQSDVCIHTGSTWDCGSSLYDSFELISLSRQIDRGLTPLHPSATPPADWYLSSLSNSAKVGRIDDLPCICRSPCRSSSKCDCNKKKSRFRWPFRFSLSSNKASRSDSSNSKNSFSSASLQNHFHLHQHEHHHHHHHYHHHHHHDVEEGLSVFLSESMFIVKKLFPSRHRADHSAEAVIKSLEDVTNVFGTDGSETVSR